MNFWQRLSWLLFGTQYVRFNFGGNRYTRKLRVKKIITVKEREYVTMCGDTYYLDDPREMEYRKFERLT